MDAVTAAQGAAGQDETADGRDATAAVELAALQQQELLALAAVEQALAVAVLPEQMKLARTASARLVPTPGWKQLPGLARRQALEQPPPVKGLALVRPQVPELLEQASPALVQGLPLQASHQAVRTCASWFQRRQPLCGRG